MNSYFRVELKQKLVVGRCILFGPPPTPTKHLRILVPKSFWHLICSWADYALFWDKFVQNFVQIRCRFNANFSWVQ